MSSHETVPLELRQVLDATRGDGDLADAAWQVGSLYALDGKSLQSLLDELDLAHTVLGLPTVAPDLVRALSVAWSEAALGRYAQLTCTDPMTGLATVQHLQTHVADLCRRGSAHDWSLLVVEMGLGDRRSERPAVPKDVVEALGLFDVAAVVRCELVTEEVMARLSLRRLVVTVPAEGVVELADRLERRFGVDLESRPEGRSVWCWIERLPGEPEQASTLIDELCR